MPLPEIIVNFCKYKFIDQLSIGEMFLIDLERSSLYQKIDNVLSYNAIRLCDGCLINVYPNEEIRRARATIYWCPTAE